MQLRAIKRSIFVTDALFGVTIVVLVALGASFVLIALGPKPASEPPLCRCGTCGASLTSMTDGSTGASLAPDPLARHAPAQPAGAAP